MQNLANRRRFLRNSAALGAGFWLGTQTTPKVRASALQSLSAGCIGIAGKGDSDTTHIAQLGVTIAGLCDVDQNFLKKKSQEFSKSQPQLFTDFREMLDQQGDKIDLVCISTPDHTHALAATQAMQMGKHVYCQKPLTWSIREARTLREIAAETGVVTQMGNQGTADNALRSAVEVVRSGAIGSVKEIHIWSNRPVWAQGLPRPPGTDPIPKNLNWDAWLGPAPFRPFKQNVYHTFRWRGWVDFGTGALGDMGCHATNMSAMALDLWDPIAVTPLKNPGLVDNEAFPKKSSLKFEFPARGNLAACDLYWYDGGNLPDDFLIQQLPPAFQKKIQQQRSGGIKTSGTVLIGSEGILFSAGDLATHYQLLPHEKFKDFTFPEPTLPRIPSSGSTDLRHKWEFVQTVKGEYKPGTLSNFDYAGKLTETILVGNLALRSQPGKRIAWDAKTMSSPNAPELNPLVDRSPRKGWELPTSNS